MPRVWRDLINEYGWNIVAGMIEDGHRSAAKLEPELIAWRERRQEAWLAEIPYPRRSKNEASHHPNQNANAMPPMMAST